MILVYILFSQKLCFVIKTTTTTTKIKKNYALLGLRLDVFAIGKRENPKALRDPAPAVMKYVL